MIYSFLYHYKHKYSTLYVNLIQAALYCFNILLYSSSQIIVYTVQTTNVFFHNSE